MDPAQFCLSHSLLGKQLEGWCSFINERKGNWKLERTNVTLFDPKRVCIETQSVGGENKDPFCNFSLVLNDFINYRLLFITTPCPVGKNLNSL